MSDPLFNENSQSPPERDAAHPDGADPRDSTVEVAAEYRHRYQAEHARALLGEQGIHSIIWSDDGGGVYPPVGFIERYQIRVLSHDLPRVMDLLEEFGLE